MAGEFCPMIRKKCIEHRCKFYIHLLGKNPQSTATIDNWDCAIAFLPVLLIEGAQQTRQAGAAIESFRNEAVKANHEGLLGLVNAYRQRLQYDENNDNP